MKNYLLKIAYLGTLCFGLIMFSCSDDDGDNSSDDSGQIDNDGEDQSDNNDDSPDNGSIVPELTSTCSVCPELIINQTNSSTGSSTFTYPAGTVCKGEDGKAYYENGDPVDELGLTYEQHIDETLASYGRFCEEILN